MSIVPLRSDSFFLAITSPWGLQLLFPHHLNVYSSSSAKESHDWRSKCQSASREWVEPLFQSLSYYAPVIKHDMFRTVSMAGFRVSFAQLQNEPTLRRSCYPGRIYIKFLVKYDRWGKVIPDFMLMFALGVNQVCIAAGTFNAFTPHSTSDLMISREAFLTMADEETHLRRAFVYDTFRDLLLSPFFRPGTPSPGAPSHPVYDYNPSLASPEQAQLASLIMSGVRPGGDNPISTPTRPLPPSQHGSQDPEITILMHALEDSYRWAHYYLHTHGFGDEASWIQDRYDLSSSPEGFVQTMASRFGDANFSEYLFIYFLFKEL
ncbi:hypothetical protein V5O48_009255 [Marasmius crinis-equi]|uniref:Uncharacterized protein n=1 Tax=Marasmius crinis-equi TaxID=585013 RepID=A0ABR3FC97_9AGAR